MTHKLLQIEQGPELSITICIVEFVQEFLTISNSFGNQISVWKLKLRNQKSHQCDLKSVMKFPKVSDLLISIATGKGTSCIPELSSLKTKLAPMIKCDWICKIVHSSNAQIKY